MEHGDREAQEVRGYEGVSVFSGTYRGELETSSQNFNVIGEVVLTENEKKMLNNNPKLAILDVFDEETLERDIEVAGMKVRRDI